MNELPGCFNISFRLFTSTASHQCRSKTLLLAIQGFPLHEVPPGQRESDFLVTGGELERCLGRAASPAQISALECSPGQRSLDTGVGRMQMDRSSVGRGSRSPYLLSLLTKRRKRCRADLVDSPQPEGMSWLPGLNLICSLIGAGGLD